MVAEGAEETEILGVKRRYFITKSKGEKSEENILVEKLCFQGDCPLHASAKVLPRRSERPQRHSREPGGERWGGKGGRERNDRPGGVFFPLKRRAAQGGV